MKLASFMYKGTRYFVCLDGGYLERSFPGLNAVPLDKILSNAGYSAAVSQSWGSKRPQSCPVSEDARVDKVGNKFVVFGTCGGVKFELKDSEYKVTELEVTAPETKNESSTEAGKIVESVKEEVSASEAVEKDKSDSGNNTESVKENKTEPAQKVGIPIGDAYTEKRAFGGVPKGGMGIKYPSDVSNHSIGNYGKSHCTLNGRLAVPNRNPNNVISETPANHTTNKFRGMKLGSRELDKRTNYVPVSVSPTVKTTDQDTKKEYYADPDNKEEKHSHKTESKPSTSVFALAPKPHGDDFDVNAFLSELSAEQRALLERIPDSLIGRINEFSQRPISEVRLEELGEVYCVQNKWKICGTWYAIDVTSELSRHFYCSEDRAHFAIHIKTLNGWKKYKESTYIV